MTSRNDADNAPPESDKKSTTVSIYDYKSQEEREFAFAQVFKQACPQEDVS
jgi:hypothetical protein